MSSSVISLNTDGAELAKVFEEIQKKTERASAKGGGGTPFSEITDDDIDNLFSV